ncbi:hypothetical protein GCM10023167_10670 [Brevibacterium pityocampae]|uniref:Uncharacterized protein n=1 Tax=Brevibacterium pityocampae TaxID=506594 RepID=A0ABP8J9P7_9MICO
MAPGGAPSTPGDDDAPVTSPVGDVTGAEDTEVPAPEPESSPDPGPSPEAHPAASTITVTAPAAPAARRRPVRLRTVIVTPVLAPQEACAPSNGHRDTGSGPAGLPDPPQMSRR